MSALSGVEAEVPPIDVESIKSLDEARETILQLRNQLIGARSDIRLNLQRTEVIHSSLKARTAALTAARDEADDLLKLLLNQTIVDATKLQIALRLLEARGEQYAKQKFAKVLCLTRGLGSLR